MLMASSKASEEASGLTICTKVNPDCGTKITIAEKIYKGKQSRDSAWKGHYCCVPDCRYVYGGEAERSLGYERVSFHSFLSPTTDKERALKWIAKIRRNPGPEFLIIITTKMCSNHFTIEDYTLGSRDELAAWRVLKKTAIPSLFPWSNAKCERTTRTSQKARTEIQANDHEQVTDQFTVSTGDFKISEQSVEDIDDPDCDSLSLYKPKLKHYHCKYLSYK